jgi:hypothetical protein
LVNLVLLVCSSALRFGFPFFRSQLISRTWWEWEVHHQFAIKTQLNRSAVAPHNAAAATTPTRSVAVSKGDEAPTTSATALVPVTSARPSTAAAVRAKADDVLPTVGGAEDRAAAAVYAQKLATVTTTLNAREEKILQLVKELDSHRETHAILVSCTHCQGGLHC